LRDVPSKASRNDDYALLGEYRQSYSDCADLNHAKAETITALQGQGAK
jgi:hypothetical protein